MSFRPNPQRTAPEDRQLLTHFAPRHTSGFHTNHLSTSSSSLSTPSSSYHSPAIQNGFRQGQLSDEDETVLILCSLQTLISPTQQSNFGANGQLPCEGHFIVLDVVNPRYPIFDKGFVFYPPSHLYRQSKDVLQSVELRSKTLHGVDPRRAKIELQRFEVHKKATGSTATIATEKAQDVAHLFEAMFQSVSKEKLAVGSGTALFVADKKRVSEVKQALLWMQSQPTKFKFPHICVKSIQEVLPEMDNVLSQFESLTASSSSTASSTTTSESWKPDAHRCALHPRTSLNTYGNPLSCCMEEVRRMQHQLVKFSDAADALLKATESDQKAQAEDSTLGSSRDAPVCVDGVSSSTEPGMADSRSSTSLSFVQGPRPAGHYARNRQEKLAADAQLDDDLVPPEMPDFMLLARQRLREAGFLPPSTGEPLSGATNRQDEDGVGQQQQGGTGSSSLLSALVHSSDWQVQLTKGEEWLLQQQQRQRSSYSPSSSSPSLGWQRRERSRDSISVKRERSYDGEDNRRHEDERHSVGRGRSRSDPCVIDDEDEEAEEEVDVSAAAARDQGNFGRMVEDGNHSLRGGRVDRETTTIGQAETSDPGLDSFDETSDVEDIAPPVFS
jgi:hypothetical protein